MEYSSTICYIKLIDSAVQVTVLLLILCLLDVLTSETGTLKSLALIAEFPLSPYTSVSFYLVYVDALLLEAYMLKMVISSWRTDSFIFM